MAKKNETVIEEILSVDKLPTQSNCIRIMEHFERNKARTWREFCEKNGIYLVVHDVLVTTLCDLISGLPPCDTLEVCAGNGKLTYWLNKRGLQVRATDDLSYENIQPPNFVEKLSHTAALMKYNPQLVLACFPDQESDVPLDVLNYPSVRYFIHLGNAGKSVEKTWAQRIKQMPEVIAEKFGFVFTYPTYEDNLETFEDWNVLYKV